MSKPFYEQNKKFLTKHRLIVPKDKNQKPAPKIDTYNDILVNSINETLRSMPIDFGGTTQDIFNKELNQMEDFSVKN